MRILLVAPTAQLLGRGRYGGVEQNVRDFAEVLIEFGHPVTVAAPVGSKVPKGVELMETVRLPDQRDRDDISYYNYVDRLGDFDVVHDFSHTKQAALAHPNLPAVNMVWNLNPRGPPLPRYNLVCLSRHHAEQAANSTGQVVKYEDLGVDMDRYKFCLEKEDYFLFVGNIVPEKGVLDAISFCKELGVSLHVCGGTSDPTFAWQVYRECDDQNVVYHGDITNEVKIGLLKRARAVIYPPHPAHAEQMAFWMLVPEALSCGTPLITYNQGCLTELFEHQKHGFLVEGKREFLDAMKNIGNIKPGDCREFAERRYDRRAIVKRYLEELYVPLTQGLRWA